MIGLGITRVGILSMIVAALTMIRFEAVAIVVGIIKVIGNQAKKTCSLKVKIKMLACTAINTISGLVSKALRITPYQVKSANKSHGVWYVHMDERRQSKSKTSLSKTGNVDNEATELLCGNKNAVKS